MEKSFSIEQKPNPFSKTCRQLRFSWKFSCFFLQEHFIVPLLNTYYHRKSFMLVSLNGAKFWIKIQWQIIWRICCWKISAEFFNSSMCTMTYSINKKVKKAYIDSNFFSCQKIGPWKGSHSRLRASREWDLQRWVYNASFLNSSRVNAEVGFNLKKKKQQWKLKWLNVGPKDKRMDVIIREVKQ